MHVWKICVVFTMCAWPMHTWGIWVGHKKVLCDAKECYLIMVIGSLWSLSIFALLGPEVRKLDRTLFIYAMNGKMGLLRLNVMYDDVPCDMKYEMLFWDDMMNLMNHVFPLCWYDWIACILYAARISKWLLACWTRHNKGVTKDIKT